MDAASWRVVKAKLAAKALVGPKPGSRFTSAGGAWENGPPGKNNKTTSKEVQDLRAENRRLKAEIAQGAGDATITIEEDASHTVEAEDCQKSIDALQVVKDSL
jgi:hypothetical protein